MLDTTTLFLYSPFEREVATPTRYRIKGREQFEKFVDTYNGLTDCYCDLYPYPFNGMIDKIYYDFDSIEGNMKEALPSAQVFYRFLVGMKKLSVIPVVSGKKGFNLYVILKEQAYPNAKQLLRDVAYSLIVECFGKVTQLEYIDKNGKKHPTLAKVNEKGEVGEIIYIDPKVIGDVRRFSRIPNTLRPPLNNAYCTYLDPSKFAKMTIRDVYKAIKHENSYAYHLKTYTTLKDIEIHPQLEEFLVSIDNSQNGNKNETFNRNLDTTHLELALRPCLFRNMLSPEPRHDVRVASTGDLIDAGFSTDEITDMYRKLKWIDWDEDLTRYQIEHCKPIHYSKRKLKELGLCFNCGRSCR